MTKIKIVSLTAAILILGACSSDGKTARDTSASDETEIIQLDTAGLQGEWRLDSYRLDCESTQFDSGSPYILTFNEPDNLFGMTTDCNMIGGGFRIANDTIRFVNIAVTEMACDVMTVEENMLRLFSDSTAYAICHGDTLQYTAPSVGSAIFVHQQKPAEK